MDNYSNRCLKISSPVLLKGRVPSRPVRISSRALTIMPSRPLPHPTTLTRRFHPLPVDLLLPHRISRQTGQHSRRTTVEITADC